ncbi:MAG: Dabb family protein [Lentisphaeria bacterium]|nr:Dabb family protein [Lentisphaeria bacterium]
MVKHIILWKLKSDFSAEEKAQILAGIKTNLESLAGVVPGLLEIKVNCEKVLASSNADLMLDSTLESPDALKGYAVHPAHVAVADTYVRPFTEVRLCLDYEI